jgi:hypothetical protein
VADHIAGPSARTVSSTSSRCVSRFHGGSQSDRPWPRRSGARTWSGRPGRSSASLR